MARNRVGVVADGEGDVVAGDVPVEPTESDDIARKKQKKQNELLRKKKAERRAHAKQRKQAQAEATQAEEENPAVHEQSHIDEAEAMGEVHAEDKKEDSQEVVGQPSDEAPALQVTTDDLSSSLRLQEDVEPSWIESVGLKGPASPPPALPVLTHHDERHHQAHTQPESPSHSHSPAKEVVPSDQLDAPQQESSLSLPSEAATLSADETETTHTLRLKKVKKKPHAPEAASHDPNDDQAAAAKTIQKALKKSLLKKTKRTLQKAKSFIRHSSKVLADESCSPEPPQPVSTRPAIVPPLALKPRPPLPSSSSEGESERSASSSSGESSPTRTASRPSSSGTSSGSSYSSRSSSSASEPSPPRHKKRGRKAPANGPSVDMLLFPPMPREEDVATDKRYGELHHHMAVRIQARVRGIRGRTLARQREIEFESEIKAEALREIEQEASVRIQAHVKGFLERRRLGIHSEMTVSPDHPRKGKRKNHHRHKHPYTKPNSVMPQGMVDATTGGEPDNCTESDEGKVAEWPEELNIEPLDTWDELNSIATPHHDPVTTAHFLSRGKLRVFCGTWNLHAKRPTDDLRLWIPSNKYHIVAVGTEECVHSIAKSVVFTSKKQWEDQLKETLGDEYVLVAAHSLTAIHNVVFVHESLLPYVHSIQSDAVATGLGNQLGNKGGVGIAFMVGHTSLAFVNCHFDAHQHNVAKRNANFHRINQELQLSPVIATTTPTATSPLTATPAAAGLGKTTASRFSSSRAGSSSMLSGTTASRTSVSAGGGSPVVRRRKLPVSESFDRVFWYGDLNYRINGTRRMIDLLLLHNHHAVLRFNDQLRIEMAKGNVFAHFQEGPLHFRPTYKFDKHSNVYDSGPKQRIPSWTDRILYLSNEKPHDIELLSYRSHMNFQTSDHRPVGAVFQVAFSRDGTTTTAARKGSEELTKDKTPETVGGGGSEAQAFARVLAKGYKPNQTRSEVCVVQ